MSSNQTEQSRVAEVARISDMPTDLFATFNITYECEECGRTYECEECEDDNEEEDEEPTEEEMEKWEEDFMNAVKEAEPAGLTDEEYPIWLDNWVQNEYWE